jgi:citrate lyase subunit beta/citryl-CoA lyase
MMTHPHPVWRSPLYVPAHVERFIERAHTSGADYIRLELEDSVPAAERARPLPHFPCSEA